ncbi:DUF4407 domain-containing protein [Mucilaginibacter sp. L3T2-6]|uniref:DUF4407 domain-containing protein n=1 Tax=Mucilaginibacter sp. L3T2-6 TaxID=3062491 RepID=UPI0026764D44|nr:DUF4407 domain-containing protein [Mucilaginibacter sp. L3T2-6]MDO3641274.1 DUF4407 domain-containing protein [Mucilaginibacter sp. L3T2-6]MDV6213966.1 DUF4407 domain-containing protein [Mucilaginibacter sp. L3T2-6]
MSLQLTLWKASGEDPWILAECGHPGIQNRFALIGLIGRAVAALSFISCCYSFAMLFDNIWMAIPVSLIFAWMVNNIYEVLLGTLAKPVLKNKYEGVIKHLSISLRIGFIVFFAVFISKPLEAWLFEGTLSGRVEQLKAAEIRKAEKQIGLQFQRHVIQLEHDISKKQRLSYDQQQIQLLQAQLTAALHDRDEALQRIGFVIGRADYFIQRIQLLTSGGVFALSWLVTTGMVVLFLSPVYLKWKINTANPYLIRKTAVYRDIVESDYLEFKETYRQIFLEKYQLDIRYHERHTDPPYNTQLITDARVFGTQEQFFERYL